VDAGAFRAGIHHALDSSVILLHLVDSAALHPPYHTPLNRRSWKSFWGRFRTGPRHQPPEAITSALIQNTAGNPNADPIVPKTIGPATRTKLLAVSRKPSV